LRGRLDYLPEASSLAMPKFHLSKRTAEMRERATSAVTRLTRTKQEYSYLTLLL
jgi:hypothetical protein